MNQAENRGFTLIELIVVIFIISIMLMVSFPNIGFRESGKLKSEAASLASVLRYLNDSAVTMKETYVVKFDLGQKTLSYKGPEGEKTERINNLSNIILQTKGVVSDGEVNIFYTPMGVSESFVINLKSDDYNIAVSSNSLSGRIRIVKQDKA
ncbi:MAG: prepilin-type N-terminal cleavage/methylation domain-containing protein [Proteobacteria bacterium]|nr:prepilin-type N-terminal cleavage/methylation domain-containing protein [Pseudomonadota bacterium]MBU4011221.1 prepilin-type N-terminal cleavage/methylation domain-containing protein [Pseudomonadota bacterium]